MPIPDFLKLIGLMTKKPSPTDAAARKLREVIGKMHQITELNKAGVMCNVCMNQELNALVHEHGTAHNALALGIYHHAEKCGE